MVKYEYFLISYFRSSFANQGEICLCTSRVYVQKGIYDQFLEGFVERTRYSILQFYIMRGKWRFLTSVNFCRIKEKVHCMKSDLAQESLEFV